MAPELRENLEQQNRELRARLEEADDTLRAVRGGEVDAFVIAGRSGDQIYTLAGADEAYRVMIQGMAEGAVTLTPDGLILFSNEQFATILRTPLKRVIGSHLQGFVSLEDANVLAEALDGIPGRKAQVRLITGDATLVPVYLSVERLVLHEAECLCLIVTDLSEQKRNEEIVAAEKLARSILEQAAEAILVVDPQGRIIRASRVAEQLAGTSVLHRQFDEVYHIRLGSGAPYPFEALLYAATQRPMVRNIEATALVFDNRKVELLLSAAILFGNNSRVLGCVVNLTDITERKLREAQLRFQAAIIETTAESVVAVDPHFRVTFWNSAAERLYGISRADALGKHLTECYQYLWLNPEDEELASASLAGSGTWSGENIHVRRDGSRIFVSSTTNVIGDEHGGGMFAVTRDITASKKAEALLRASEARERSRAVEYQALMEAVPAAVFIARDPLGLDIIGNRMSYDLLRVPPGVNLSKSGPGRQRLDNFRPMRNGTEILPENLPIQLAARTGQLVPDYEFELVFNNGTSRCWLGNAVPILDETGKPSGSVGAFIDITERKQAEEQTRESRDWLETTLRSIGDGVIATDTDGKVTFLNAVAQSLTGFTQQEATGAAIDQIFVITEEQAGAAKYTMLTSRDGRQVPIDKSAAPIRDARGEAKGTILVFRDVTQQREAETRLTKSAERLRALMDANPIGVIAGDIHGGIHEANDAYLSLTGYTREEFVSGAVNWKTITPPEHLPLDAHAIAEARLQGTCTPYEKEYVRKDGSRVPVYLGFAVLGETREETIAFVLDLTDRKRAEEKLTQQIRRLIESNIVGIVVSNERQILEANDSYLAILGHSREDLIEGRVDWREATPPDHLERDIAAIQELRERGSCAPFEKEYVRTDGTRIPVLVGAAALSQEPELTWISYVVDLTAQKALDRDLRLANQRLSAANEELQSFAYFAAHDLKSPLRTISSMTEMLMRQVEGKLGADSKQMAAYIQSGVKQMNALISDLLDYAKVAGDTDMAAEAVDCARLFALTVMNLQSQIRAAGATVTSDPLPTVQAGNELAQVFQNVLENALKYRSERPPEIHVSARRKGDEWIFSVRDNGIGFEMQYAEHIFGVFQRLHGYGQYEGTGIGLAICKKTIERFGGKMWVESEPGAGSTFYFSVPAALS